MPRTARLVIPGYPHHVTQRGSRRQQTFFVDTDYQLYLDIVAEEKEIASAAVWAYCLMPNHIHFVVVPETATSLAKLFGRVHQRYAVRMNKKREWQGHLWQSRYYSTVMDDSHTLAALRYVEMNPVRAGLCEDPTQWNWSSIHARLGRADKLVCSDPEQLVGELPWLEFLAQGDSSGELKSLRDHTRSGHPAGDDEFVRTIMERRSPR